MITLTILGIVILIIALTVVTMIGGAIVMFIDPIIAIALIWLVVKFVKWIIQKLK